MASTSSDSKKRSIEEGPRPQKAYRNNEFLNSGAARLIRVMCELEEPKERLEAQGVDNIIMFFGSARAKPRREYERALQEAQAVVAAKPDDAKAKSALERLEKQAFLIPMFDCVRDLARLTTEWSMGRQAEGKPSYTVGTGG